MDTLEIRNGVALLALNAGKANAMTAQCLDTIDAMLARLEASEARAAVITGYEKFFSAGLALPNLIDLDRPQMKQFIERFAAVMMRVFDQSRPIVAAINGHAIAGGCVLALQCDWRIMSEGELKIGLNEVQIGIGLPSVVTESLQLAVPPASLVPIAMEGHLFSPARAKELGLVHEVVPASSLLDCAFDRARELAAPPSSGVAQVKAALRRSAREAMTRYGAEETASWLDSWFSPEGRQRVRATVDKLRK
jgi:enoyl-CoA hydratase